VRTMVDCFYVDLCAADLVGGSGRTDELGVRVERERVHLPYAK